MKCKWGAPRGQHVLAQLPVAEPEQLPCLQTELREAGLTVTRTLGTTGDQPRDSGLETASCL